MSELLSAAEVEAMRAELERSLPDEVTILVQGKTKQPGGSWSEGWNPGATIPARVSLAGGGETDVRSGNDAIIPDEATHVLTIPADSPALKVQDRLDWNGTIFEILLVAARGEWGLSRRVHVKEL